MKRIPLTQGQFALVDDDLFDQLHNVKWFAYRAKGKKTFYARRGLFSGRKILQMHRVIWELVNGSIPSGYTVDHCDRDGLNNQAGNLRLATMSQQAINRSKHKDGSNPYIGISLHPVSRKWVAVASVNGKPKHLGVFADPFSAAWVRDQYVRQVHGEFAVLNNLVDRRSRSRN